MAAAHSAQTVAAVATMAVAVVAAAGRKAEVGEAAAGVDQEVPAHRYVLVAPEA